MPERELAYRQVALIGMMGVGKTTVGRMLATCLGWTFWDNDEALAEATGKTAAQVQQAESQSGLHAIEDRLLQEALRTRTETVFAAAGSVVLKPSLLAGVPTVWLRASAEWEEHNIARSGQRHRPLPPDAIVELRRLQATREPPREPLYTRAADITIDVAPDAQTTCDRVLQALTRITPSA